jgi:phospholipid/cholesterol/gamma-HCH transport system substrate-binding protein
MENRAHAFAAGLFVVAVTALLVVLAAWLMRDAGPRAVYEISTRESVTGLQPQAPVRLRGVAVGRVASIGFDPQEPGNVRIRLEVAPDAPVTEATYATLGLQGVTGLSFVQLDDEAVAPRLVPGAGPPPRIPLRPNLVTRLTDRSDAILDRIEQSAERLNQLLGEPNQQRVATALERMGEAAVGVSRLAARTTVILDAQLGPDRTNIPEAVASMDAALDSLRQTSEQARVALAEFGRTVDRLNEAGGPVERLGEGAAALAAAAENFGAATLPRINQVAEETARAARQLQRTVGGIDDNPQSLIFGRQRAQPGPGEPGFQAPGGGR